MKLSTIFLHVAPLALFSCAYAVSPVTGFVYTDVKAPVTATANGEGSKKGESCAKSILGIVALGDASIEAASKNGTVTKISRVDYTSTNILGFYSKFCTVVTGN